MANSNFNLRGINPKVMAILKSQAEKKHVSVNSLILVCIEQSIGYSRPKNKPIFNELDHLASTWKKDDLKIFEENTAFFEKIDKDIW